MANDYTKIRLVAAGTKAFTRQDIGSHTDSDDEQTVMRQQFRILDDAVQVVLPFILPTTILSGHLNDLKLLLETYYPLILSFDEPFRSLLGSKGGVICRHKSVLSLNDLVNRERQPSHSL